MASFIWVSFVYDESHLYTMGPIYDGYHLYMMGQMGLICIMIYPSYKWAPSYIMIHHIIQMRPITNR